MPDRLIHDAARRLLGVDDVLVAEVWASTWLGQAWVGAPSGERDPEAGLCDEVAMSAASRPTPQARVALAALRLVAPPEATTTLDEAVEALTEQPSPAWEPTRPWQPTRAWRAENVWGDERVLFVEFDGPQPHTLTAVVQEVGGTIVDRLSLLEPGAAQLWDATPDEPGDPPMPLATAAPDDVLTDLAEGLHRTDMYWPRHDDEEYIELRMLAWARSRAHLRPAADWQPPSEADEQRLVDDFVAAGGVTDDEVTRSVAEIIIEYGDGHLPAGALGWSPGWVGMFLNDYLPRKVILDRDQRAALPGVLRAWLRFALARRGVDREWIDPVVDAVDEYAPEFEAAFDDETAWGPAKQITVELAERGVDLTDRDAVDEAMRALNAEKLARRLRDDLS